MFTKIEQALRTADLFTLAELYLQATKELVAKERAYAQAKLKHLDFSSRTALDKQEFAMLQENPELRQLSEEIAELKALIKCINFCAEQIKLGLAIGRFEKVVQEVLQ